MLSPQLEEKEKHPPTGGCTLSCHHELLGSKFLAQIFQKLLFFMCFRPNMRARQGFYTNKLDFFPFPFKKASFQKKGNLSLCGSTCKTRVRFHHFQVKSVRVKFQNIFKNAYFLPIFTTNHGIYTDLWILWNLYKFKRNLMKIYGV